MESQKKAIKAHLESGKPITALQALNEFGCFRLAARIKNLKDSGMLIDKVMVTENGKRFAVYWAVK
tara:strand:+ start:501 stop:698 length:198 start_codon:yes stop_codon:yes gene_type:complete